MSHSSSILLVRFTSSEDRSEEEERVDKVGGPTFDADLRIQKTSVHVHGSLRRSGFKRSLQNCWARPGRWASRLGDLNKLVILSGPLCCHL